MREEAKLNVNEGDFTTTTKTTMTAVELKRDQEREKERELSALVEDAPKDGNTTSEEGGSEDGSVRVGDTCTVRL
jgi:hypothetical protein